MNFCVCNGIYSFVKSFEDGKIPNDITMHQCACGCVVWIVDGSVWFNYNILTTKPNKE